MSYVPTTLITNRTVVEFGIDYHYIIIIHQISVSTVLQRCYVPTNRTIIPTVILSLGLAVRTGLA